MDGPGAGGRQLSRRDWALIAIGAATWVAIAIAAAWFVHQLTRPMEDCGRAADAPTHPVKGSTAGPRNAFQAITGQGRCP